MSNVAVFDNTEEAMLVPSVTKYNEIYMPDIEQLEEPKRMANITYIITNSNFSRNGIVDISALPTGNCVYAIVNVMAMLCRCWYSGRTQPCRLLKQHVEMEVC